MHSKTNAVFITGTDTDAGKTVFCGQLLAFLRRRGIDAISQKWVQTGWGECDDAAFHASVAGIVLPEPLDIVVPMRFKYPASPHVAARLEHREVDTEAISSALGELSRRYKIVLCEGSGGALVPLSDDLLMADFAARMNLPAIIVSANRLGCINHTLMTAEALRSRRIPILGIAFTRVSPDIDEVIASDNIKTVRAFSGETVLGEIGWLEHADQYSPSFDDLGDCFLKKWSEYSGRTH